MNYKRLETFIWVATLGSFRKAAEQMHTTQPAISARISGLESELGVKLFEREGGSSPIALTAKGKELLPYVEKILYQAEELRKRTDVATAYSGTLRLGVSETIANTWLPALLTRIHEDMPNLEVEMTVDVTTNLAVGVKERSLDLGLLLGPLSEPSVVNVELCHYPLSWVASPKLDLPDRLHYLEELANWPIITYARNTKPYTEINHRFRCLDGPPARFFASTSLAACRSLAIDAVGIATLPDIMIDEDIELGKLKKIKSIWSPSDLHFTASYSDDPINPFSEMTAKMAAEVAKEYADAHA
ncbi:LysR family transcriptional regulator [Marinomonas mediterranea]|uniref:LysR family transcriptional regulator n=1 Tax=Marinomonas mediterranea TaxID=119864 RepID=UPI00234B5A91|nr:LysR family transcriptional regulator [Marinomonas mediterranea]WCN07491.1 LysR family transcriptional regulator [Marinomonas mediterranea]WCN11589.1 LysR family transcriptional regulator [Marinomonas mediterranea]